MLAAADEASGLLKALANRHRLIIICQLIEQERSVGELAALLKIRDSTCRSIWRCCAGTGWLRRGAKGRPIWYSIGSPQAPELVRTLYRVYCAPAAACLPRRKRKLTDTCAAALRQINDRIRDPGETSCHGRIRMMEAKDTDAFGYRDRGCTGAVRPTGARSRKPSLLPRRRLPTRRPCSPPSRAPTPCQRVPGLAARWCSLRCEEGDHVAQDQVVAIVADEKLALQIKSLDAQISGLQAQLDKAKTDLARAARAVCATDGRKSGARCGADSLRYRHQLAEVARVAERSVVEQQVTEGKVLAPTAGRVLTVPVTTGTVIMAGEPVATIAEQNFVLRLRVPERHARFLKAGDPVRIDGEDLGKSGAQFGSIRLVYPQIEDGRVIADAAVAGLGDYFVGERIRVWISAGERTSIIVPGSFIETRFGIDYARVRKDAQTVIDVPVQRGRELPRPDMPDALEILSGLRAGDVLGAAVKLGLSGRLTQATIRSPLTPLFLFAALAVGLIALLTIPARGRAADQRAHGRHSGQRRWPQGAGRGRTGDQAARGHRQGHRRRRARLQPDGGRSRHGDGAFLRRHQRRRRHPARS